MKTIRRGFFLVIRFLVPFLFLLVTGWVVFLLLPVFGPISPEKADIRQIQTWMYYRDISRENPNTQRRILGRICENCGKDSGYQPEFEFTDEQKEKIRSLFPDYMDRMGTGAKLIKCPPDERTLAEKNIRLIVNVWILERMNSFEEAEKGGKDARDASLEKICEELDWWNRICVDFMVAAELPIPSLLELVEIMNEFIEELKFESSSEDAERIDRFYKSVIGRYTMNILKKWGVGGSG